MEASATLLVLDAWSESCFEQGVGPPGMSSKPNYSTIIQYINEIDITKHGF